MNDSGVPFGLVKRLKDALVAGVIKGAGCPLALLTPASISQRRKPGQM